MTMMLARLLCLARGHAWHMHSVGRRTCTRCGAYEVLVHKFAPTVDSPSEWRRIL